MPNKSCVLTERTVHALNRSSIHFDVSVDANADADAWCEWRNWKQCFPSRRHFLETVIVNKNMWCFCHLD